MVAVNLNGLAISTEKLLFLFFGDKSWTFVDQSGGSLTSSVERLGQNGGQAGSYG